MKQKRKYTREQMRGCYIGEDGKRYSTRTNKEVRDYYRPDKEPRGEQRVIDRKNRIRMAKVYQAQFLVRDHKKKISVESIAFHEYETVIQKGFVTKEEPLRDPTLTIQPFTHNVDDFVTTVLNMVFEFHDIPKRLIGHTVTALLYYHVPKNDEYDLDMMHSKLYKRQLIKYRIFNPSNIHTDLFKRNAYIFGSGVNIFNADECVVEIATTRIRIKRENNSCTVSKEQMDGYTTTAKQLKYLRTKVGQ